MHTSKLATSVKGLTTSSDNQWRSSLQLKFLVVGIDYFTKWVEAEALATITEKNVQSFV